MDRAKQGTKRSWLVEGGGVPVGLSVAGANRNDFKLLEETLQSIPIAQPAAEDYLRHLCLDKGYDYAEGRRETRSICRVSLSCCERTAAVR